MTNNSSIFNKFGKTIFITGANSGIGFYSTIKFLETENYLYVPIRSKRRKDSFINKLRKFYSGIKSYTWISTSNKNSFAKLIEIWRNIDHKIVI